MLLPALGHLHRKGLALVQPIFPDGDAAHKWLESVRWSDVKSQSCCKLVFVGVWEQQALGVVCIVMGSVRSLTGICAS